MLSKIKTMIVAEMIRRFEYIKNKDEVVGCMLGHFVYIIHSRTLSTSRKDFSANQAIYHVFCEIIFIHVYNNVNRCSFITIRYRLYKVIVVSNNYKLESLFFFCDFAVLEKQDAH